MTRSDSNTSGQRPPECIAVLGPGQMGLVCSGLLVERSKVLLWGHDAKELDALAQSRRSPRLPGFVLPATVACTSKPQDLARADMIISAIPVQYSRTVWRTLGKHAAPRAGVVCVAKGIETATLLRPTQVIADALRSAGVDHPDAPARPIATLSGPTIATELAKRLPAAMIASSDDEAFARLVQHTFATWWLRIYTNPDVLGVELAGAVKNVIAIAAGICDGLQAGNNAKSALLARGLAEIVRLGVAMGASPETFFGIAGVGDLATTCFSPEGRNRSCGEALGKGRKLDEYLASTPHVVEGVETTRGVLELARKYRVELPIVAAVHAVLFESTDPIDAISQLMTREQKAERVG
jgi:glycerol-3-phosphate dehydrogenase (NAD(P)+)